MKTSKFALAGVVALALVGAAPAAFSQSSMADPMVGGAAMYPTKTIVENAMNSSDHTTLVAAVKAAGLVDTLSGPGPFTVFAPTNEAFDRLPPDAVASLMKPENKDALAKVLTYHVVAGRYTSSELMNMVRDGGGTANLKTVEGETLAVTQRGHKLMVHDAKGGVATVTIGDVVQSNGVIYVVNRVLMPS
jgi:uncharacterized surface protein with fasciclin (FAS1) repeats